MKLTHVPFKGTAEVHGALAGKQIYMASMNIGEALQYARVARRCASWGR